MATAELGTFKKVDLREVWPHEALDFTRWLAEAENLSLLGEAVGMTLELRETESSVGSFSVDIFATDADAGTKVVIENQLEDTNHDHLGKIITYAAGKGAQTVVWVVKRARDEHRQAVEWLNAHTDSEVAFFLVEVEVWRIGESLPAPRFSVVERPNDWARAEKAKDGLSETGKMQIEYWQRYREAALDDVAFSAHMRPQKPQPQNWSTVRVGTSRWQLAMQCQRNRIGIEAYVPNDKDLASRFIAEQKRLEGLIGAEGVPFGEGKKAGGIRFFRNGLYLEDRDKWDGYIAWQLDAAVKLREALLEIAG